MKAQKLAILNSLVTFAAENVPGGLSEEELSVAREVGVWALMDAEVRAISPIPIRTAKGTRVHYLYRGAIHQTVCGLSTEGMQRYYSADIHSKPVCSNCKATAHEAAKL